MSNSVLKTLLISATIGLGCMNAFVVLPSFAQTNETKPTPSTTTKPSTTKTTEPATSAKSNTIIDVASGNSSFTTLVTAIKAAGLVETLSGKGPFTVFAPTDAAFKALPKGTLEMLLKPENKAKLTKVLTYHVVAGKIMAKDVKPGNVKTVEGSPFAVKVAAGKVMVNAANVTQTDIPASNGVIHVIDKVILPPNL
jgi:uncharacterized surface protein with fasciclin (FAS1) repeats